ncbi:hypothetical protein BH10BDE1_BH10BDE1_09670 [soil metagenome]
MMTSRSNRFSALLLLAATFALTVWIIPARAAEPVAPPDHLKPKTYETSLRTLVTMRMGDTVTLKGTDFSAKLVGFTEPSCAVPGQNCGVAFKPDPYPDFEYFENGVACDPKKNKEAQCMAKLVHTITHEAVWDRSKVKVQIIERRKRK